MHIKERRQLLQSYRQQRETVNRNPFGEAVGRIYIDIPEDLAKTGQKAKGVTGFIETFSKMLSYSPVEIRPGELIVGNYYFLLPYELIPITPPVNYEAYSKRGALPVPASGHSVVNVARGLELGWNGLLELINRSRTKYPDNSPEAIYLDGEKQIVALIQQHIRAYAREAERLAQTNSDLSGELLEIANRCFRLATDPPQSFHDALQWFYFWVTFERSTASGMGSCRLDQVFYPFYQRDSSAGILDKEKAQLLFECLFMKEPLFMSLGGVRNDGSSAVNELSYLALAAYDTVGGSSNLSVRWHPKIEAPFMDQVADLLSRHGSGVPIVVNDEVIIPSLTAYDFSLEQARGYAFAGCFWYVVPGKEFTYHDLAGISAVRALVRALDEARTNPFTTFEQLWHAYAKYVEDAVVSLLEAYAIIDPWFTETCPEMITTLLMDGCLEKGKDFNNGGPEFNMMTLLFIGLANITDSLYAIKKHVFVNQTLTFTEVLDALDNNFKNHERTQKILLATPKYGNGNDEIDQMAVDVAEQFKSCLKKYKNSKGGKLRPSFYSYHRQTFEGQNLPATPDGRYAGKPLALSANPYSGSPKKGITAVIQSMTRIKLDDSVGGPIHIHLHGNDKKLIRETIASLIEASFKLGAMHLNINVVDKETLLDAIDHPEQYTDLVIRVTGYSARFVLLDRKLQEEIASRNSF
jgi:pyruvate-formate lyase